MNSKNPPDSTPGGKRAPLSLDLPLDTPYLVQMFPCYACNFRCEYCIFAISKSERNFISDVVFMDWDLYTRCIDDMKGFNKKLKMLRFAAIGEPLLHPRISDMVEYAKSADIAHSIDIVTNASKLNPDLSHELVDAGLGRLRISLEGLSSEEYKKNAKVDIDFEQFVDNIRYFYEHKKDTFVYIKIIDYMIKTPGREELFHSVFSDICDALAIENLTPTIHKIDYYAISGQSNDRPQNGACLLDADVCPQGFYLMQINPDGKVVPCCNMTYPDILGNAQIENVVEIWNGSKFNDFRIKMLQSRAEASLICQNCLLYRYGLHEEDILDGVKEELLCKYTNLL